MLFLSSSLGLALCFLTPAELFLNIYFVEFAGCFFYFTRSYEKIQKMIDDRSRGRGTRQASRSASGAENYTKFDRVDLSIP